jgi:hypothetical protein
MGTQQLKFTMLSGWLIALLIWLYIFYKKLQIEINNDNIGKNSFICSPTSICKNDGWWGPYIGTSVYKYTDPNTNNETSFIPGRLFKNTIPNSFTFTFWLRVVYDEWKKPLYRGSPSPVFIKGGIPTSGIPGVFIDQDIIKFQVTPLTDIISNQPELLKTDFPFDQWVQYSLVCNKNTAELYVNGLLRETKILGNPITITKSPLYIGRFPDFTEQRGQLPGEILYFTYYNKFFSSGEIDKLYKDEREKMNSLPSPGIINDGPENCPIVEQKDGAINRVTEKVSEKYDELMSKLGVNKNNKNKKAVKPGTANIIDTAKYDIKNELNRVSKYIGTELFSINELNMASFTK